VAQLLLSTWQPTGKIQAGFSAVAGFLCCASLGTFDVTILLTSLEAFLQV
jgi:hypothetical protein